jgi:gamma-glutamyltranspeptidase / glutathione hydrolase
MINKFHVAGGHKDTVVAAYNVLQEGGNAFDAAIAGVFASMACEYIFTGVASGGGVDGAAADERRDGSAI